MVRKLKDALYFWVAGYFRFFARIQLERWHPRIVVVTGSNGKTTTLNLLEVQLGKAARYSHKANSSFGIPFDILGLKRRSFSLLEWPMLFLFAPVRALKTPYKEAIYVVEADCDRPHEGDFLSALLTPDVVVWLSSARTHSMNYERVAEQRHVPIDECIAYEFGYFAARAKELVIANGDVSLITSQLSRASARIHQLHKADELKLYTVTAVGTEFDMRRANYRLPYLLPEVLWCSIEASALIAEHFGIAPTTELWSIQLPPSRSSMFKGIKNTTLVDSSYNANVASVTAILDMVRLLPAVEKWLVLGDLIEQGAQEKAEHEKIAALLQDTDFRKIILVGPRMAAYALPLLHASDVVAVDSPKDALAHIEATLRGSETLVFKGARFLEGVVEHLLLDKADAAKLCRREPVWVKRRAQWGL